MKRRSAGIVITELISATGIEYKNDKTLKLMSYDETQRPIGIQLFGEDPETMASAAIFAQERGADFIDLNFGCPVPKVTKKGAGSAILKDLPHLTQMIRTIKKAIRIPLTIKIRTGWDQDSRNAHEVVKIAFEEGVTWVAIHGRTRAQSYSGLADWDYIAEVKSRASGPILGNGDLVTAEQAVNALKTSGCDGVLIGRGSLKNPLIFEQCLQLWKGETNSVVVDHKSVYQDLFECIAAHCDDRLCQLQMKKFAAWFATGYPNAAQFRKSLFQCHSTAEVVGSALEFFSNVDQRHRENKNNEGFLMGGHG